MNENFLLDTPLSRHLYHKCAKDLPIIDYHNHLNLEDLTGKAQFSNLAELWVLNDPYKHRAMRICGVNERYITGNASAWEKFEAWMSVLPRLIGNPLYDWSVLEMKRVFGIEMDMELTDAKEVWEKANNLLSQPEFTPKELLYRFGVEYVAPCTTLTDDLSVFSDLPKLAPSLRGDNIVEMNREMILELTRITGLPIETMEDLQNAVAKRLDEFNKAGCRFSDHALDDGFLYVDEDGKNDSRLKKVIHGDLLTEDDRIHLRSAVLRFLSALYAKRGWTMQLHIGAQRYTSSKLREIAGPAGGFAGIGNCCNVSSLTKMLDNFEKNPEGMPRILLFTLNPSHNAAISVLSGSYYQDGIPGKIQQGPAWWWCDHLYGMRELFENISAFGVLSVFIGMTTDSRSILSMVRHEYFRRALCGWIGEKSAKGVFPDSYPVLEKLVEDICYNNAKKRIMCEEV